MLLGSAASKVDCDILYCFVDDMLEAARSGEVFQKPVVIKELFSDAGMHNYERFLSLLEDAFNSEEQAEVRCINIEEPMCEALGQFTAYLRSHPKDTNGFWVSTSRNVASCHRPLFTMLTRFRLLESVTAGLHDNRFNLASSPLGMTMSVNSNTISFPAHFLVRMSILQQVAGSVTYPVHNSGSLCQRKQWIQATLRVWRIERMIGYR
jgi:hypothetical protein